MGTEIRYSHAPLAVQTIPEKLVLYNGMFGKDGSRTSFLGLVGTDAYVEENGTPLPPDQFPPGRKRTLRRNARAILLETFGLIIDPRRVGVGQTGANVATAFSKYGFLTDLHAPISPTDESTAIIRQTMSDAGVNLMETPHDGQNPSGVHVLPHNGQKTALLDKSVPPIEANFHPETGFIMLTSTGENWDQDWRNAVDYARKHNIPYGIVGSESQIEQIKVHDRMTNDERARAEEKKVMYLDAMSGAVIWSGNDDEARIIVGATGVAPSDDPQELAVQMRNAANGGLPAVAITLGPGWATLLFGNQFHSVSSGVIKSPKNAAGAGDQFTGALLARLRDIQNGFNIKAIGKAIIEAMYATLEVIKVDETIPQQMTQRRAQKLDISQTDERVLEYIGFEHNVTSVKC